MGGCSGRSASTGKTRDVFAIQDEIARTIVNTLRASFLGEMGEPVPRRYTAESARPTTSTCAGGSAGTSAHPRASARPSSISSRPSQKILQYALAYTGLADSYALQLDYRAAPVDGGHAAREGAGAARHRPRRHAGRGAHLARLGHLHPRLGLEKAAVRTSSAVSRSIRAMPPGGNGTPGTWRPWAVPARP